jgi:hypothetical protein
MSEIQEQKPVASQEPASEKEVINTFQNLRQEVQQLFSKINELESEKSEHTLVIGAPHATRAPGHAAPPGAPLLPILTALSLIGFVRLLSAATCSRRRRSLWTTTKTYLFRHLTFCSGAG